MVCVLFCLFLFCVAWFVVVVIGCLCLLLFCCWFVVVCCGCWCCVVLFCCHAMDRCVKWGSNIGAFLPGDSTACTKTAVARSLFSWGLGSVDDISKQHTNMANAKMPQLRPAQSWIEGQQNMKFKRLKHMSKTLSTTVRQLTQRSMFGVKSTI